VWRHTVEKGRHEWKVEEVHLSIVSRGEGGSEGGKEGGERSMTRLVLDQCRITLSGGLVVRFIVVTFLSLNFVCLSLSRDPCISFSVFFVMVVVAHIRTIRNLPEAKR